MLHLPCSIVRPVYEAELRRGSGRTCGPASFPHPCSSRSWCPPPLRPLRFHNLPSVPLPLRWLAGQGVGLVGQVVEPLALQLYEWFSAGYNTAQVRGRAGGWASGRAREQAGGWAVVWPMMVVCYLFLLLFLCVAYVL